MQYREYGKTGKMVSVLGFGTSRFRPQDYATEEGQDKLVKLLLKAKQLGVNVFDTWDQYGNGQCEAILGHAFKEMQGAFFVSTKSPAGLVDADGLRRQLDASLTRLGIEKIHFYHLWRILNLEQFNTYMRKGGVFEGALRAQQEGLIDHICFSAHCDGDVITEIISSGCFEGVLLGYNIINFKYREQGLLAAKQYGLGVGIMGPLGGGVITQNAQDFAFAVQEGENISDVALNFCASNEAVTLVLSGMTNEQELEQNVASLEKITSFPTKRIEKIKAALNESYNSLCNGCRYCAGCPKGLEPYSLMLAYNDYVLHDYKPRALFEGFGTYCGFFPRDPFFCTKCGICEKKCSQHIPISKHIAEINILIEQREKYLREGLERCFGGAENMRIGIYGAGAYAQEMLLQYREVYDKLDIEFFIFDSNPERIGKKFSPYSFVIHHPEDIALWGIQGLIIASEDYYDEIFDLVSSYKIDGLEIVGFTLGKQYKKIV